MADPEQQRLTTQQQQPQQVVLVPQNQNIQYVYQQPPAGQNIQYVYQPQPAAGGGATATQQQVVIMQSTDSTVARQMQEQEMKDYQARHGQPHGYHQPHHRVPVQPQYDDKPSEEAEVNVVKWDNFRMPIPVNHATFMRKVWLTLVLQLIFTAGMIAMCMYVDEIREWVLKNTWMYIIGLFGSICVLCCLFAARNNYPINILLLILFTAMMAYTVATICAAYADMGMAPIVMQAFGITILVFLSLSIFSCQTKCNLMPLGMVAFMMLSVMLWWGLWSIIFGWYNSSAWALMFIIIFCLLIMFDVWRMCNMPVFEESAWILGAINLYLDVINLFLWILRCMAISQR